MFFLSLCGFRHGASISIFGKIYISIPKFEFEWRRVQDVHNVWYGRLQ